MNSNSFGRLIEDRLIEHLISLLIRYSCSSAHIYATVSMTLQNTTHDSKYKPRRSISENVRRLKSSPYIGAQLPRKRYT